MDERGRARRLHPRRTSSASCGPTSSRRSTRCRRAVNEGKDRFLFEMATGTGKTLTAAAVIKLFLRTGNARRVLFLVDRLELEDQAKKAFAALLSADFQTVIYKENRDDWRQRRDRGHHGAVAAVQQQVPGAVLADRLRPRDLRRSAPLDRRQCPRRVRLLHRLQARPDRHAAGLPQAIRHGPARHPRSRASSSAACCSTPTGPSAARTASRPSATHCSTASRTATWSTPPSWMPAPRSRLSCSPSEGFVVDVHRRRLARTSRRPSSSASSRSDSSPTRPTSSSARRSSSTRCATRSAARSASRSSLPSARTTPPSWRRS